MKFKKFYYKKVGSTNNTAIRLIKNGIKNGIIMSELQSKGKGQRGNQWISKKGNLFMSIFFEINKKIYLKKIIYLNILIIKKIIAKMSNSPISIKKPNDILINKKKVCGILQETIFMNNRKYLVVGVGINLVSSPKIDKYETTFLNNYSKKKINKLKLFNNIKTNYEKNLNYFKI